MIDPRILAKQFDRLRALNYFSQDEVVQQELRDAMQSAPSEIILTAAIGHWLRTQTERPTPADLYRVIREQAELTPTEEYRPDPGCATCNGEGFRHFERDGLSYLGPRCECWARRPPSKVSHPPITAADSTRAPRSAFSKASESVTRDILRRLDGTTEKPN